MQIPSHRALGPFAALGVLLPLAVAQSPSKVETFEAGLDNLGAWTYAHFDSPPHYLSDGGNPGWGLQSAVCCGTIQPPRLHTMGDSAFTGDLRQRNVTRLAVDVRVEALDPGIAGHNLSLMLWSDNGTPDDEFDDWGAFTTDPTVIQVGQPWQTIAFDVPAQSPGLPAGWDLVPNAPFSYVLPPGASWDTLIRDVSRVSFEHGPALVLLPADAWLYFDVRADNVVLEFDPLPGFDDLAGGLAGAAGPPLLAGQGSLAPGSTVSLKLSDAAASTPAFLGVGFGFSGAPLLGGFLIPDLGPGGFVQPVATDVGGGFDWSTTVPGGLPPGMDLWAQTWILDPSAPQGVSASNGLGIHLP